MPPVASIRHYRFVQDAWDDGMAAWLRAHAAAALRGEQALVVVADPAQAAWLRQRSLAAGIALLGVKFLTAAELRRELAVALDEPHRLLGRESLEFLLKLAALARRDYATRSVALAPAQCLQALDDLGRAGWSGEEADLGAVPSPARDWLRVLAASGAWAPEIDRQLTAKSSIINHQLKIPPTHLCCWAWDRELGAEWRLLSAALTVARDTVFFVPSPLEDFEYDWLADLERLTGATAQPCADSGFVSANDGLTAWLFQRDGAPPARPLPTLLIGARADDELALLERAVWRCLEDGGGDGPIGVVFPRRTALSRRLLERLTAAALPVTDRIRDPLPADWAAVLQQQLAAYYLRGCQVDEFLALAAAWHLADGALAPARLRQKLTALFARRLTRHTPTLLAAAADHDATLAPARELALTLGEWPAAAPWEELKDRWQRAVKVLRVTTDALEPLWSRLDAVLTGRVVDGAAFLEYVHGLLKPARLSPSASPVFANIELVTLRQAAGRVWRRLIFAESNEGGWPLPARENPFLPDPARAQLNRRRGTGHGWLFTARQRQRLEDKRLRDALDNCAGAVIFTASAADPARPGQPSHPNSVLAQLLLLQGGPGVSPLDTWRRQVVTVSAPPAADALDAAETARLADIAARRNDPARPFDEYSFCYPASLSAGEPWSVTKLEGVRDRAATTALTLLFKAEAAAAADFQRNEALAAGTLTHRWIERYLAGGVPPESALTARLAALERELRRELGVSGLWLETLFNSARWMTGELLALTYREGLAAAPAVRSEQAVTGVVSTSAGRLALRGKFDLVLADGDHWRVFDFKTGKRDAPTDRQLARGEGLQFGAYLLLALTLGARTASVQCLSPRRGEGRTLTLTALDAAAQGLARAARAQQTLTFGLSAKTERGARAERLPLACVPAAPAVLQQKAALTFGAAEEAGDEQDD
ncbi:MAG: PD-(D/E)XK nuclease family protein [Verrucomicrobiales bacterium]|jgi:hypothetical protein|nr:PD-(D/E)XK nuclease family protein [Verrucomicrobiales bacterium]